MMNFYVFLNGELMEVVRAKSGYAVLNPAVIKYGNEGLVIRNVPYLEV